MMSSGQVTAQIYRVYLVTAALLEDSNTPFQPHTFIYRLKTLSILQLCYCLNPQKESHSWSLADEVKQMAF